MKLFNSPPSFMHCPPHFSARFSTSRPERQSPLIQFAGTQHHYHTVSELLKKLDTWEEAKGFCLLWGTSSDFVDGNPKLAYFLPNMAAFIERKGQLQMVGDVATLMARMEQALDESAIKTLGAELSIPMSDDAQLMKDYQSGIWNNQRAKALLALPQTKTGLILRLLIGARALKKEDALATALVAQLPPSEDLSTLLTAFNTMISLPR